MSEATNHLLKEGRRILPPKDFARRAAVRSEGEYRSMHRKPPDAAEPFGGPRSPRCVCTLWGRGLSWGPPLAKKVEGGKTSL